MARSGGPAQSDAGVGVEGEGRKRGRVWKSPNGNQMKDSAVQCSREAARTQHRQATARNQVCGGAFPGTE